MRQVTVGPETESEARFCTDMGSHSLKTESEARFCTDLGSHSLKTESEARFCTGMGSHILKTKVRLGSHSLNELGLETKSKVALWAFFADTRICNDCSQTPMKTYQPHAP